MSWTPHKTCILNSDVIPVWFWLRSWLPQINNQDDFAMCPNCKWQQKPMYFYGHDGMDFYCNVGSFLKTVLYVFLPETPITCPVDTVSEGLQWSRCSTFTFCGLLLFYLLMSVCCRFICTLLSVINRKHLGCVFSFNSAENPIQWNPVLSCQTKAIRPHLLSHVDNVPYYWT